MREGGADAAEDEGGEEGGVKGADAVDDGVGGTQGLEDLWVCGWAHFLAVGVDVPDPGDAGREGFLCCFGEGNLGLAEDGKGVGGVGVFDGGGVGAEMWVLAVGGLEGGGAAGVADGVLAGDGGAVDEAGGDVVAEVADDGGEDGGAGFVDAAHDCEEVDG